MKFTTLLLCSFIWSLSSMAQNIPNGNFESWENVGGWFENPTDWETMNSQIQISAVPDSLACEANFALKVSPLPQTESLMGQASVTFPQSSVPAQLHFCVKAFVENVENFIDTCRVKIQFYNQDNLVYGEEWMTTQSIPDWEQVTLPLNQIEPILTDCKITVEASFPGIGLGSGSINTWISVDDFNFDFTDTIIETPLIDFSVFPNPSTNGEIHISSSQPLNKITVYDLLGNLVWKDVATQNTTTLNHQFSSGIYVVQVGEIRKKVVVR